MKTDKEMTQDILEQVKNIKREKTVMKKRFYKLTAISCVLAIAFIAAFAFGNKGVETVPEINGGADVVTEKSEAGINRNFFVMVASAVDETEIVINKESDVKMPLGGILVAEDTRGMSYSQKDVVMLKLKERLAELYGLDNGWQLMGIAEDTTIYFGTADYLKLKVEEADNVESITLSCSENGKLTLSDKSVLGFVSEYIKTIRQGDSITITGKEYKEIYGKEDGMRIEWFLSETMINTLQADPETPLSSASDKIEITINFVDGTTENFGVELRFDDEGMLTSTYKAK